MTKSKHYSTNPIAVWEFVCDYDTYTKEEVIAIIAPHSKSWIFQGEEGEKTGFKHWQGKISLKERVRDILKVIDEDYQLSWRPVSKPNMNKTFYWMKEETRIEGPYSDEDPYIPRQVRGVKLRNWQQDIVDDAKCWDTRHINIVYDPTGGHGKTILKTYVGTNKLGRALPFRNDYRDIMRMVMNTKKESLYLFDIPKAVNKHALEEFFSGIETLKDGYSYDDRYKFKEEYFDCPNIWIFMNKIPDFNLLSPDRWKIWRIENEELKLDQSLIPVPMI